MSNSSFIPQLRQEMGKVGVKYVNSPYSAVQQEIVADAILNVDARLDNPPANYLGGDCSEWMGANLMDVARWQMGGHCDQWLNQVKARVVSLIEAVRSVDGNANVEVLASLVDMADNFEATQDQTTDLDLAGILENTPTWLKALGLYFIVKEAASFGKLFK